MIHLLKKTRQELFSGNRVSGYIFYAIGEIILVVIGILLAIQIDSWNEDRISRRDENKLLKGLEIEMTDNLSQLEKVILFNQRSKDAARKLIELYNSDYQRLQSSEIDSLFAQVQWAYTFDPKVGILNAIKTGGKIGIITNRDIKVFIASFEEAAADATEESLVARSIIVDKFVPCVSKHISLRNRVRHMGYDITPSPFSSDYRAIFQDKELESLLTYIYIWRDTELTELKGIADMLSKNTLLVSKEISE